MKLLLIAATESEINIVQKWLSNSLVPVDVLITGVGSLSTAYALTTRLTVLQPDLVLQAGIGGSYSSAIPPTTVSIIKDEVVADMGAIEKDSFVDIFDMGLEDQNAHPFLQKKLINQEINKWQTLGLPICSGATVNNISATFEQAEKIKEKYAVQVESMEGAALHYVCLKTQIPFLQIRAISNFCGERDKSKWKLKESISILNTELQKIIKHLS